MIELPDSLLAHLDGSATTLCYAWVVRRSDGATLGFTDHDQEIEIEGVICAPSSGFTSSAIESSIGLNGDTNQVEGALSSDALTDQDISAGLYDEARILQYLVNWQDLSSYALLRRYYVGEINREDGAFRVELRSFSSLFDQQKGRRYLRSCDANLGDDRCGVDLSQSDNSAVGSVVPNDLLSSQTVPISLLSEFAGGWFAGGKLRWLEGQLSGKSFEIADVKKHEGSELTIVTMVRPLPSTPDVGDLLELTAGCDKSFHTCKAKFNNGLNFRGFPHMPGNDAALTYADDEMQFDGEPLVP